MKTKKVKSSFKVILRRDQRAGTEEECFSSFVPELNISADGDSMKEAIANTEKLIVFHLGCLAEEGEEVPTGNSSSIFVIDMNIDLPKQA